MQKNKQKNQNYVLACQIPPQNKMGLRCLKPTQHTVGEARRLSLLALGKRGSLKLLPYYYRSITKTST